MGLYQRVYDLALRLKKGTETLCYGRELIGQWILEATRQIDKPLILDIGCGEGADLENARKIIGRPCELQGIEAYQPNVDICKSRGIETRALNIEREKLPYPDEHFDVVLANQVLEHVKDHFYVVSEISRVIKKGGVFIVGVPNMAAWHDRAILLLGNQPSSNRVLGGHVRGFTAPGLRQFLETDGFFKSTAFGGSGFFPFPKFAARLLARLFPSLATAVFLKFERTKKNGAFIEALESRFFESTYFTGKK
ncbi:MAG: class I SAM-dependent methyltransferase [Chitinispirillaceae bacterium]|jgi:methionine biosynthesis protein MetW|nr:class I SAM-dependent methyltransferase [Chitinispirillaceae bacterium]